MNSDFKILYIMGTGRSGTTLLDIVIGNSDNFFSAGELNRFTKRDGLPHSLRDQEVKMFWEGVNNKLFSKKLKHPRTYYNMFKKFEYHFGIFKIFFLHRSKAYPVYAHYQKKLFTAVCNTTQTSGDITIIDSSKYPLRGFFLSKIFGNRVSLLYIKRQPSAIVESFQKTDIEQPSKGRLSAHVYLLFVNIIACSIIRLLQHKNKTSVILYEQFVDAPLETIGQIEFDLNINLEKSKEIIRTNRSFKVGTLFDGNRLRLEQEIQFRKNTDKNINSGHFLNKLFKPLHKLTWYKNTTK